MTITRPVRLATAVAAAGLLIPLGAGSAAVGVAAPTGQTPGAVTRALVVPSSRAAVGASATAVRKKSGKVRVAVTSKAKKVQVKYKSAKGKKKVRTKKSRHAQAVFSLPKGSHAIYVRARADRKLPGRGWHAVRVGATSAPPVVGNPVKPGKPGTPKPPPVAKPPAAVVPLLGTPSSAQLREVAATPVFFGHQSVGGNILGAIPALFATGGVAAPAVVTGKPPAGGGFGNAYIGQNGDPESKLADFDAWVRSRGVGSAAQVALMKLCYVDLYASFDAGAWFAKYVSTMTALEAAYPRVTFLHVTAPLTVDSDADNAARYRLNTLLRQKYGSTGRLVDLAALESTRPDGSRATGTYQGKAFEELYSGYSSDGGHLNDAGARAAASLLVRVISAAH